MSVLIVDYGMGNLASARRSFEECGAAVVVSSDPETIESADRLVIPGVGAFSEAMSRLSARGWVDAIRAAARAGVPVLGICLGMQLLADEGDEGGKTPGLGLIAGRVMRIVPSSQLERIPHVGWNEVYPKPGARLFEGIPAGADFYFVHSYHFLPDDSADVLATTPYCGTVVSAVGHANVTGVQFHPEKSSRVGFRLIKNFLAS